MIHTCEECGGLWYRRVQKSDVHPTTNIAQAYNVHSDGSRTRAVDTWTWIKHPPELALYMEFPCQRCNCVGEIHWTRGSCLIPLMALDEHSGNR